MDEKLRAANFRKLQTISLNRAAEQWIVDTLLLDGRYSNLEDLSIDRKQLTSKDIIRDNVDRLYKGLYVYSKGFNELLNQCLKSDDLQTKATVWKVFLILLERYNYSDYQLIIKGLIYQHYREVKSVQDDNKQVGEYNQMLEQQLETQQQQYQMKLEEFMAIQDSLKEEIKYANAKFTLADEAADAELHKRCQLQNHTHVITAQLNELSVKQQLLKDAQKELLSVKSNQLNKLEELCIKDQQNAIMLQEKDTEIKRLNQLLKETNQQNQEQNDLLQMRELTIKRLQTSILNIQQSHIKENYSNKELIKQLTENAYNREEEQLLKVEVKELRNRLNYYQVKIEEYLEQRTQDLKSQLEEIQGHLQESRNDLQLSNKKYENKQIKYRKLKSVKIQQDLELEILNSNLKYNTSYIQDIESNSTSQALINLQLKQEIDLLNKSISKYKLNEVILSERIKQQFETVQNLSTKIAEITRNSQSKIDQLNQQLLIKCLTYDELTNQFKEFKIHSSSIQEQQSKDILALQLIIKENKEKIQDNSIYQKQKDNELLKLQQELVEVKSQYQEYFEKRDALIQQINVQEFTINKLEKDNTKLNQELKWIETQNQGFQEKLKKQQGIIREQQKEVEQLKFDLSTQQRIFEDMKFDYDEQVEFFKSHLQAANKQKQQIQEDFLISQQQVRKVNQMLQEQSEKLKKNELQLINQTQDTKQLEMKLSMKMQQQTLQSRIHNDSETIDSSSLHQNQQFQEKIAKKLIEQIRLQKQKTTPQLLNQQYQPQEQEDEDNLIDELLQSQSGILNTLVKTISSQLHVLPEKDEEDRILQEQDNTYLTLPQIAKRNENKTKSDFKHDSPIKKESGESPNLKKSKPVFYTQTKFSRQKNTISEVNRVKPQQSYKQKSSYIKRETNERNIKQNQFESKDVSRKTQTNSSDKQPAKQSRSFHHSSKASDNRIKDEDSSVKKISNRNLSFNQFNYSDQQLDIQQDYQQQNDWIYLQEQEYQYQDQEEDQEEEQELEQDLYQQQQQAKSQSQLSDQQQQNNTIHNSVSQVKVTPFNIHQSIPKKIRSRSNKQKEFRELFRHAAAYYTNN